MDNRQPRHRGQPWRGVCMGMRVDKYVCMCIDMRTGMCTEYVDQSKTLEGRDQQQEPRV